MANMDDTPSFLRRIQAGQYLKSKYGFSSEKSLGKYATEGALRFARLEQAQDRPSFTSWPISTRGLSRKSAPPVNPRVTTPPTLCTSARRADRGALPSS
jgi:hypothetical protein